MAVMCVRFMFSHSFLYDAHHTCESHRVAGEFAHVQDPGVKYDILAFDAEQRPLDSRSCVEIEGGTPLGICQDRVHKRLCLLLGKESHRLLVSSPIFIERVTAAV